jgi:hypothetical protein
MKMQKYEKVIMSYDKAVQYFENVPMGKRFRIYCDSDIEVTRCYIVFEKDGVNVEDFNVEAQLDAFDNLGGGNIINIHGLDYLFDEPKKLYFFIRGADKPVKIYVEVE